MSLQSLIYPNVYMRCFGNGKPNLSARENTRNKRGQTLYTHITDLAKEKKCKNYNASTIIEQDGFLRKTKSFAELRSLQYGHALCAPCDLSLCACEVPLTNAMIETIALEIHSAFPPTDVGDIGKMVASWFKHTAQSGKIKLAWNVLQSPDGWNATNTTIDASGIIYTTLCCASGCCWAYDGKTNMLDNNTYDCCCDENAPCLNGEGVVKVGCVSVGCNTGAAVNCCSDCGDCGTCEGCTGGAGVIIVGCLRINCGTPPLGESWPNPCKGGDGVLAVGCLETSCDSVAIARVSKATATISTLGGDNVCVTPLESLFGTTCTNIYYPKGTFAFKGDDLLRSWAQANEVTASGLGWNDMIYILIQLINESFGGNPDLLNIVEGINSKYSNARPQTTIQNYLQTISKKNLLSGPLRFY